MEYFSLCYTNDFHSHIPDAKWLFGELFRKRKAGAVIVDTGDFTEGHPFFTAFSGIPERRLIWFLYDVISPGNHGFQDVKILHTKRFPVVNVNIVLKNTAFFMPYKIVIAHGVKIGLTGVISNEAFGSIEFASRENLMALDPLIVLDQIIPMLKSRTDAVVVMSHSGFDYDRYIARNIDGIDVILSGHCHSSNQHTLVDRTLITKAPELGRGFGELKFFPGKDIVNATIVEDTAHHKMPDELNFISDYLDDYEQRFRTKIAYLPANHRLRFRTRQAFANYLIHKIRIDSRADVGIINYHCLRGLLTEENDLESVYKCVPFNTRIVKFNVKKEILVDIIALVPFSLKEYLCIDRDKEKVADVVSVVTTDYLYENYFSLIEFSEVSFLFILTDYLVDHIMESLTDNDSHWTQNK